MATSRTIAGPGRLGSIKAAKKSAKSGGNSSVRNIPSNDSLTVRFLEEPSDWFGFYEHWFDDGPEPCTGDDCKGCGSDDEEIRRKAFRYLANAYVIDDSKVAAVKMPKSLVEQLIAYYEKYDTILDRDYDLTKSGSGKNGTTYMASPDSPSRMKTSRFKLLDLDDVLQSMLNDEEPKSSKKNGKKKSKPVVDDDDDEDDDDPWDDDDDDDEDESPKKSKKNSSSKKVVKKPVKKTVTKSSTSSKKSTPTKSVKKTVKKRK